MGYTEGLKTQSMEQWHQSCLENGLKVVARAERALGAIAMRDQLQLFETQGKVLPFPARYFGEEA